MTSRTTNRFLVEARQQAVRLVLDHKHESPSRWAAILSISTRIACTGQTLNEWVKRSERIARTRHHPATRHNAPARAHRTAPRELRGCRTHRCITTAARSSAGFDARIIMGKEAGLVRQWREKRGEIVPGDLSDNLVVQLGTVTEDFNRRWHERNIGHTI